MKISKLRLARIIREEIESILSNEHPSEAEATDDAWVGGENIELPLDHVVAGGGPAPDDADALRVAEIVQEEMSRPRPRRKSRRKIRR
jgi:siroheme synthase (precorrin-2 oxidase/ferrochelatase)